MTHIRSGVVSKFFKFLFIGGIALLLALEEFCSKRYRRLLSFIYNPLKKRDLQKCDPCLEIMDEMLKVCNIRPCKQPV